MVVPDGGGGLSRKLVIAAHVMEASEKMQPVIRVAGGDFPLEVEEACVTRMLLIAEQSGKLLGRGNIKN